MEKKASIEFEKIILFIIALIVLITVLVFTKGKLQTLIDNFFIFIREIFK
ncbi:MAG: hypothetical protein AABW58_00510 [Nanoarchaeota archaeon]